MILTENWKYNKTASLRLKYLTKVCKKTKFYFFSNELQEIQHYRSKAVNGINCSPVWGVPEQFCLPHQLPGAGRFPSHQGVFLYPNLSTVEVQKEHLKNFSLRWCSWDPTQIKGIKICQCKMILWKFDLEIVWFPLPHARVTRVNFMDLSTCAIFLKCVFISSLNRPTKKWWNKDCKTQDLSRLTFMS